MADQITRLFCLVLRHRPELLGIEIDRDGWTELTALLEKAAVHSPAVDFSVPFIQAYLDAQEEERFELQHNRIRALYGHSLNHVSVGTVADPPPILFHATRSLLLPKIRAEGLVSKGRTGVHLTSRWSYALAVKNSHTSRGQRGIILAVKGEETRLKGVLFRQATSHIWLSPYLPARFLYMVPNNTEPAAPRTFIPIDSTESRAILRGNLTVFSDD